MCVLERERDRLTFAPFGKNSLIQKGDCGRGIAVRFGGGAGGGPGGRGGQMREPSTKGRKGVYTNIHGRVNLTAEVEAYGIIMLYE